MLLAALAFLVLSGAILALYWFPEAKLLAGDERAFYQPSALALLAGGDWFDRQMLWPPLQVLILAALFALPGPDILTVQLVQLALLAGAGWLLRGLWLALTGDRVAAGWAGVLLAVNPLTIAFATYLWPEIVHLFLSLVLARALLASRRAPTSGRSVALAAAAGATTGLCLLSKSLLTAFWPLLVLALVLRTPWPTAALRAGAFVVAMALVTTPALLRGSAETGRPQIADSSWFNLWTGLADRPRSDLVDDQTGPRMAAYLASAPDHAGRVAFARAQAQALVDRQGLAATIGKQLGTQYFRLFDARNFLVAQLPGPACRGYISHYTLPPSTLVRAIDYGARTWHVALLVLFALGLVAWRDWRAPWLWLLAAFVGYQLALFLGLHVKSRFLLPMLPVICLFAGHLLAQLPRSTAASMPLPPLRRALGLALAATLVFLALAGPALDQACG